MTTKQKSTFADKKMFGRAVKDSFIKLKPKTQAENPVMFLVFVSAILTSVLWLVSLFGMKDASSGYTLAIAVILWFTVLFANFAEAKRRRIPFERQGRMWTLIKSHLPTRRTVLQWFLPLH